MKRVFLVFLLSAASAVSADKVATEDYLLTPTEKVAIEHPEQFRYDVTKDPDDAFRPAMRLRAFDTNNISKLSFKIFPAKDEGGQLIGQKEVDQAVEKISARYVEGSVEKNNTPRHLHARNGLGAYCVLTDAELAGVTKLPPGEFRYLTFAVVKVDNYVFTVRGYSNSKDDTDYKAILSVLEGLRVEKKRASDVPKAKP